MVCTGGGGDEKKWIRVSVCWMHRPFFELLRIYLKENAPFAGGTGSREDPFYFYSATV